MDDGGHYASLEHGADVGVDGQLVKTMSLDGNKSCRCHVNDGLSCFLCAPWKNVTMTDQCLLQAIFHRAKTYNFIRNKNLVISPLDSGS